MKRKYYFVILSLVLSIFLVGCDGAGIVTTVPEEGAYTLRDIGPAGGYIFYDRGCYIDGWRYLEAAPISTEWMDKGWGSYGTEIGETEWGNIGAGQRNTTIIVPWLNSHGETDRAAQLCDALVYGGYSDWFLPSVYELHHMYTNLKVFGVGGLATDYYWSSSENGADYAWVLYFGVGSYGYGRKNVGSRVRAARAF